MKINKKYKALKLYQLSKIKQNFEYEWYISKKNWYFVKWFLLTDKLNRKKILNWILTYATSDLWVTKKILDENVKYVVWLFSEKEKSSIDLLFGKNKEVLEKFNKKITSNKYKRYFDDDIIGNITSEKSNINLLQQDLKLDWNDIETKIGNDKIDYDLNVLKTIKWVDDFITHLNNDNISTQDLINNDSAVSELLNTIEKEIQNGKISKPLLNKITKLNYPFANKIKMLALNKIKNENLKYASQQAKKNRLITLNWN